jgi:hypothetical protein
MKTKFIKFDDELQIVYSEVYAPDMIDTQGDFTDAVEIRKMGHDFMRSMALDSIDMNHDHQLVDAVVVESFIVRKGDEDFIEGSWVVGIHISDVDIWTKVKKGEINGFSMDGAATATYEDIEINVPEELEGRTYETEGHTHVYILKFSPEGVLIGGETVPDENHEGVHVIKRGTKTEDMGDHSHRYSFVEEILKCQK